MTDVWSKDNIQIGISALDDFTRFPPHYFTKEQDIKLKFDPSQVNVFSNWRWLFENEPYSLEYITENHNALLNIKEKLLTLPTFFSFILTDKRTFPSKSRKFMIYINPNHQATKNKLQKLLDYCDSLSNDGRHYALEIRLDDALATFCRRSEAFKEFSVPYESEFICITNGGKRFQIFYRNPWCWLGLFPVALIFGVPYCLCRKCFADDITCQIVANVTLIKHHDHHHSIQHYDNDIEDIEKSELHQPTKHYHFYLHGHVDLDHHHHAVHNHQHKNEEHHKEVENDHQSQSVIQEQSSNEC